MLMIIFSTTLVYPQDFYSEFCGKVCRFFGDRGNSKQQKSNCHRGRQLSWSKSYSKEFSYLPLPPPERFTCLTSVITNLNHYHLRLIIYIILKSKKIWGTKTKKVNRMDKVRSEIILMQIMITIF